MRKQEVKFRKRLPSSLVVQKCHKTKKTYTRKPKHKKETNEG